MTLQTRYDFTLPRGYVDAQGVVHREGTMRLATARDELEPLRDPMIDGPDDPRLTIVVLARVVERLGTLPMVTAREVEGLFAADLAFLQDFYGVINFGSQTEYEELLAAQRDAGAPVTTQGPAAPSPAVPPAEQPSLGSDESPVPVGAQPVYSRPTRAAIEEIPQDGR
ncbi:hypothetical protein [Actinotalea sp. K2]|uniref:hypothetical protein n=1 Tax=Actinotalea sp. K2 TaxID=2939438 RepID=UPI002017C02E|nr:hypothetical protein [Actinotalea sp. K2]MCL3861852.1 hypothetical protein [Actinotalea sp. K2]